MKELDKEEKQDRLIEEIVYAERYGERFDNVDDFMNDLLSKTK